MVEITKVQTEAEYDAALARISELLDAELDTPEGRELDRLSDLVIEYEDEHYPMDDPDPHSMLEFMLDQQMATRDQLIPLAGSDTALDAILAGSQPITPELATLMNERTGMPVEVLLKTVVRPVPATGSE